MLKKILKRGGIQDLKNPGSESHVDYYLSN